NCYYNRPHKKCARIVGDVTGKYHPHGELSVYDALVRMAQDFSLRACLIDGQGNFGSIDGDSPAATRYTEARLSKLAHLLLNDIDKDTINFEPNYDGSEKQPEVLPASFLNLLINGSNGIAVGMATNIPSHNITEVANACIAYIENNDITIDELMEHIPGPDFPTAGVITGKNQIRQAYNTGKGIITLKGVINIEEGDKGRQNLIITEIPYGANKAKIVEKIYELGANKTIEGISEIRDESNKSGIRVVIELKKDAYTDVIINQLFSYTNLQCSFGINMLAINNKVPKLFNLKEMIEAFIKFREDVILRRTQYLLKKDSIKAHVLLGLCVAVYNIDDMINLIKLSGNVQEAKDKLSNENWNTNDDIKNYINIIDVELRKNLEKENEKSPSHEVKFDAYALSEDQIKAILDMRLNKLTNLEKNKILEELASLVENIKNLMSILNSKSLLLSLIKEEMEHTKQFCNGRLTKIQEQEDDTDPFGLVPKEDMIVTVTLNGYIKRTPLDTCKTQHRGGKGKFGLVMNPEDSIIQIFNDNTHALVLFFSNFGYVYSLKLYKLPLGSLHSKGKSIVNLLNLREGEKITNIMCLPEKNDNFDKLSILFITKLGKIRRNSIKEFISIRATGKIAIKIDDEDALMNVLTCDDDDHIFIATKLGKAIRFPIFKVRAMKSRTSDGVIAIKLQKDDIIVAASILENCETNVPINNLIDEDNSMEDINIEDENNQEEENLNSIEQSLNKINITIDEDTNEDEDEDENEDNTNEASEELNKKDSEECILSITSKGFGKKSLASKYRTTNRGGVGVTNINITPKTVKKIGTLITALTVHQEDEVLLITSTGKMLRFKVSDIRNTSRNTSGVIIARLEKDEVIVSASVVISDGIEANEIE
ncbi:MAG: DNA topoisomerase (ATP-hydrolyzing) subunit A, partial [Rickettsiales bacterium]